MVLFFDPSSPPPSPHTHPCVTAAGSKIASPPPVRHGSAPPFSIKEPRAVLFLSWFVSLVLFAWTRFVGKVENVEKMERFQHLKNWKKLKNMERVGISETKLFSLYLAYGERTHLYSKYNENKKDCSLYPKYDKNKEESCMYSTNKKG